MTQQCCNSCSSAGLRRRARKSHRVSSEAFLAARDFRCFTSMQNGLTASLRRFKSSSTEIPQSLSRLSRRSQFVLEVRRVDKVTKTDQVTSGMLIIQKIKEGSQDSERSSQVEKDLRCKTNSCYSASISRGLKIGSATDVPKTSCFNHEKGLRKGSKAASPAAVLARQKTPSLNVS